MFKVQHLTITKTDGSVLLQDLNFQLNNYEKLAIIGEEGTGKSTLLKIMSGFCVDYADVKGNVICDEKIGYFHQSFPLEWQEETVLDYLLKDTFVQEIEPDMYNQLQTIEQCWIQMNGNVSFLYGDQKIKSLSGGEKVRLQLLKLMVKPHDYVFMDEPSNDLDIKTLLWMEKWIQNLTCPCVFISHDQKLLEACATRILHIEQVNKKSKCRHTLFNGTYNSYITMREASYEKQKQIAQNEKKAYQKQMEKIRAVENAVSYAHNHVSRQNPYYAARLKSKLRSIHTQQKRIEEKGYTKVDTPQEAISLFFEQEVGLHPSKQIFYCLFTKLEVSNRLLCERMEILLHGNDKIAITGDNGCGKTTLLKEIYKKIKDKNDMIVGYMPQNYLEEMDENITLIDFLCSSYTREERIKAANLLGSLHFREDEMYAPIKDVSDGQKAKAYLASFVMRRCNILLLDEPTRNLSPLTQPVIYELLKNYQGCIVCVSHDRKLLEEVFHKRYEIRNKKFVEV